MCTSPLAAGNMPRSGAWPLASAQWRPSCRWSAQSAGCASSMSWQFEATAIVEASIMAPASGGQTYPAIATRVNSTVASNANASNRAKG